jgi:hypothetical protein
MADWSLFVEDPNKADSRCYLDSDPYLRSLDILGSFNPALGLDTCLALNTN